MTQLIRTGMYNATPGGKPAAEVPGINELGLVFTDSRGTLVPADSLKGKVVLVNFWATWCAPCRAEMPSLNSLYKTFKDDKDIMFLFVTEDEEPADAMAYLQANKFEMPMYTPSGQPSPAFYTGTLPTTLLFDKSGGLVYKHDGMANYNTSQFISRLRGLQQAQYPRQ